MDKSAPAAEKESVESVEVVEAVEAMHVVQIVGTPVACSQGVKDTSRDVAAWAAEQLHRRFGDGVRVEYFDLFDPACPEIPEDAQLPLVSVNHEVLSSGGKISVPAIRKRLEALGSSTAEV